MSLGRVFRRKQSPVLVVVLFVAVALLLAPAFVVTAYNGHGHNPNPKTYPIGTVCGDALAGPYSPGTFSGSSSYDGWGASFSVTDMVLSGGTSGTVTASSGSVSGVGHGYKLVSATFGSVTGTYEIKGGSMHVTFEVSDLSLTAPFSMSLGSLTLPVTLSCNTHDTSL